jgi:hypothetical protein
VRVESFASPLKGFDKDRFELWRVKPVSSTSSSNR